MGGGTRILTGGTRPPARRIDAAVFEADRTVREMVAAAEERARAIVEGARAERERIVAEASAEGRRAGEARAAALLVRAAAERDRLLAAAPAEIARLALAVARKVLGRAVLEPDGLAALVDAAVAAARGRREVVVRLAPADAAMLREGSGRVAAVLGAAPVEVREDAALARGDVVVDTEAGRIEAGLGAQLDALARTLEEALG